LLDIIDLSLDPRSGVWDQDKEIFYFSKYLKTKIDEINLISDVDQKNAGILQVSQQLNVDKEHILNKINENLRLIGEEIKTKDQININEYLEKTGMIYEVFIDFINNLGLNYLKKADLLLLNSKKIEEATNSIKQNIIDKSKKENTISLGIFESNLNLIEQLIKDLQKEGRLRGIFYKEDINVLFYTEKGIRNLMLENSLFFSFEDLFYGKELTQDDINLLSEILENLIKSKQLKGNFNKDSFLFSSEEVIFSTDYNTYLYDLEKTINRYIQKFDIEFHNIKRILTKTDQTIYPQEIKTIQDAIDRINSKYVLWRDGLDAFIKTANRKLLKAQGVSTKKYKKIDLEKQEDIKSFEEDIEVHELMKLFNNWVKIFNELEQKYPNIIFYQKRVITNPEDKESKKNLYDLLNNLNLTN
jgi:hypothetical protein